MDNSITFKDWKYALHDARYGFVQQFAQYHPQNVLILACGVGLEAFILSSTVDSPCKIVGIDIDKKSIAYAKEKLNQLQYSNITFKVEDINHFFSTNTEKFDAVMIMFAIHFFDRKKILENVSQILEPDGIFGICEWEPNDSLLNIKHINEIINRYANEGKVLEKAKRFFNMKNKYLYEKHIQNSIVECTLQRVSHKSKKYSIRYSNLQSYWNFQKNNELFKRLKQDMLPDNYLQMIEEIESYVALADESEVVFIAKVGNSFYKNQIL